MKTLSLSEAKMKLSELVDTVSSTDEEITITRNGCPAAVTVSPDEFDSWKEIIEICSNPDFLQEIRKGLTSLKNKTFRLVTKGKSQGARCAPCISRHGTPSTTLPQRDRQR